MIKYKNFKQWFSTKIIIPETKLEQIQKNVNSEILKKYKNLAQKDLYIIDMQLINVNKKTINVLYEYLVTIGIKEFDDED